MGGTEMQSQCWLCIEQMRSKKDGILVFAGYRVFSSAPWDLTNTGVLHAAIFQTEGDSYQEAQDKMMEAAKHCASLNMKMWQEALVWIDDSWENQDKKFEAFMANREYLKSHGCDV